MSSECRRVATAVATAGWLVFHLPHTKTTSLQEKYLRRSFSTKPPHFKREKMPVKLGTQISKHTFHPLTAMSELSSISIHCLRFWPPKVCSFGFPTLLYEPCIPPPIGQCTFRDRYRKSGVWVIVVRCYPITNKTFLGSPVHW